MKTWIPLHDYQVYAKDFMLNHPFCGLFLKMGLGKTSIVLEALYELNPTTHVLVVAPKAIARCTWQNEIKKWNLPLRTQSLVLNERQKPLTKKKRDALFDSIPGNPYATVYFVNREMVTALVKRFPKSQWPFGIVILDESQSFKSYNSERFKALKTVRPYMQRMTLLTGSPTPKGLMDLWSQIYLLDMGERLGKNITAYRTTYFNPGPPVNGYPVDWFPKKQMIDPFTGNILCDDRGIPMDAERAIYNRIKDIVISMKNTYIKLPPITYNNVPIQMTPDEYNLYKKFKKESILDLEDGSQIDAANAAVLTAKLSQMASGAIYTDAKKHEYSIIHEHKLEMCEYICNNTDSPVLIAYHFKSDHDMLVNYLKKQGMEPVTFNGTPQMELDWNQGKYPIMLIQPASCGFGLNFQNGGHTLIWYTIPWSLEEYEQTNARIYRQGQTEPVMIHHLLTDNTIDHRILNLIHDKSVTQENLLEAIKAEIQESAA